MLLAAALLTVTAIAAVLADPGPSCSIAAAGDIAEEGGDQADTARVVKSLNPTAVLTLGDNAYPDGSSDDFRNYYDPTWGGFKAITRPAVGNHDYQTPGAAGYLAYFHAPVYYSYDLCGWHLYSLNREITGPERAAELGWLRADLGAHHGQPMLAVWHEPRWTSGTSHGSDEGAADLWDAVVAGGVRVVLSGHEHSYERLAEMDSKGNPWPGGTREIIVGEGGNANLTGFGTPLATTEKRISGVHGVLSMDLRPDGYDWKLMQVGGTVADQGTQQFTASPAASSPVATALPQPTATTEEPSATTTASSTDPGAYSTTGMPGPSSGNSPPASDMPVTTMPSWTLSSPTSSLAGSLPPFPASTAGVTTPAHGSLATFFGPLTLTQHGSFGLAQTQMLLTDAPGGRPALRVTYPAGSASMRAQSLDGTKDGGAQAYLTLPRGPLDEAWLAYDLRFPAGFQFVKGGKLPGLFGGTVNSGQHIPDGTNGFSTRYMWRADGAGEVYAYLPTSVTHGTSLGRGTWTWPTGRWAHIVQHIHLNDPTADDGTVEVWLDGNQVLHQDHVRYRTVNSLRIDGLFFSTFFGGGDASWASPTTQHADFANFIVSATPLSPR